MFLVHSTIQDLFVDLLFSFYTSLNLSSPHLRNDHQLSAAFQLDDRLELDVIGLDAS